MFVKQKFYKNSNPFSDDKSHHTLEQSSKSESGLKIFKNKTFFFSGSVKRF